MDMSDPQFTGTGCGQPSGARRRRRTPEGCQRISPGSGDSAERGCGGLPSLLRSIGVDAQLSVDLSEDDAVVARRGVDCGEAVEHIGQAEFGVSFDRVSEATTAGHGDLNGVTSFQMPTGDLRGPRYLPLTSGVLHERSV